MCTCSPNTYIHYTCCCNFIQVFEDHIQDISQPFYRLPVWLQQHCLEIHREAIPWNTSTYVIISWAEAHLSAPSLLPPPPPSMLADVALQKPPQWWCVASLPESISFLMPKLNWTVSFWFPLPWKCPHTTVFHQLWMSPFFVVISVVSYEPLAQGVEGMFPPTKTYTRKSCMFWLLQEPLPALGVSLLTSGQIQQKPSRLSHGSRLQMLRWSSLSASAAMGPMRTTALWSPCSVKQLHS